MTPPSFLYFDLGNVLFSFDHALVCQQVAQVTGLPLGDVQAFFAADHHLGLENGSATTDELFGMFCSHFDIQPNKQDVVQAACDIFQLNTPIVPLLSRLALSNHRMGVLSNTSEAHWEFLLSEDYAILSNDLFEIAIRSYEDDVRAMKPDRKIYDVATERAGVPANEIFFTDDRQENVDGALAAGWPGRPV